MAQFHVGQRVRIVGVSAIGFEWVVGREATIAAIPSFSGHDDCSIEIDGLDWRQHGHTLSSASIRFCHLRPLTDPLADAFIERIKKLGKEPINDAPKVTVTK